MSDSLAINEIFLSLQGESSFAGWPCIFIRLAGCNLRCSYCDTAYAFTNGRPMTPAEVYAEASRLAAPFGRQTVGCRLPLVELTGGEPLLQAASLPLMTTLCDDGFTVLLETSGALDISTVDPRVRRIMDLKCPGSGESERNRWGNINHLRAADEVKFVIVTREDYNWARRTVAERKLAEICTVLFSWAQPLTLEEEDKSLKCVPAGQTPISRRELAERITSDSLPVRLQVQIHKVIWPPNQRGV